MTTLKENILQWFKSYHNGKGRPIKREDLLEQLSWAWERITDREMRLAYEDLPICGGPRGLYLPETKGEIDEQIKLHWSKIYSYFRKIDILEHYQIESDSVQKNLF